MERIERLECGEIMENDFNSQAVAGGEKSLAFVLIRDYLSAKVKMPSVPPCKAHAKRQRRALRRE